MVPEQKRAWFVVVSFAVVSVGILALAPFAGLGRAWHTIGLCGPLFLVSFLLFRKKRDSTEVVEDERDRMIWRKAWYAGAMSSYVAFVAGCFIPWAVYSIQGRESIEVDALNAILISGAVVLFLVRAVATLVLYRGEASHGEE